MVYICGAYIYVCIYDIYIYLEGIRTYMYVMIYSIDRSIPYLVWLRRVKREVIRYDVCF